MRSAGPTSGSGGREFTDDEQRQLIALCELYGFDAEDEAVSAVLLDRLWRAYGSYRATEKALSHQVGVVDEIRDLETLLTRSRLVLALLSRGDDTNDDDKCVRAAAALSQSLHAFPMLIDAQTTCWPERESFIQSRHRLRSGIVQVRLWPANRGQFIEDLSLVISVCERIPSPEIFTKRTRTARHLFRAELASIYRELLHPQRHAIWELSHEDANDPPPPVSTAAFARAVMAILGVKFEVK